MLGKRAPRYDGRTFAIEDFVDARAVPAPPPARDWTTKAAPQFGMMLNDQIGCCGSAGKAHLIQIQTAANGSEITLSDRDVLDDYSRNSGYIPGQPATDGGEILLDSLNDWRQTGIGGHRIGAYVKLQPGNKLHVEQAINLFGGVYIGAALPAAAQDQTVWDVARPGEHGVRFTPGSWGGHCMAVALYNRTGVGFITWGTIKIATWEWFFTYVDEAYAVISDDWVTGARPAPNGFDFNLLRGRLAAL